MMGFLYFPHITDRRKSISERADGTRAAHRWPCLAAHGDVAARHTRKPSSQGRYQAQLDHNKRQGIGASEALHQPSTATGDYLPTGCDGSTQHSKRDSNYSHSRPARSALVTWYSASVIRAYHHEQGHLNLNQICNRSAHRWTSNARLRHWNR